MKLQPTAGAKMAHTALTVWWSLASSTAITIAAAGERGEDDRDEKRPGRDDGRHRATSIAAIAARAKRGPTLVACPSSATSTARSPRAQSP